MTVHFIKCASEYYDAVRRGDKTFEARVNDRDYRVGDKVIMREFPYTNSFCVLCFEISYILDNQDFLRPGVVILGIRDLREIDLRKDLKFF